MKNQVHTKMSTLIRRRWRIFLLATIAATAAQIIGIPQALLTRKMVKLVAHESVKHIERSQIEHTLWILGSMLVGLTLFRGVCKWSKGVLGERFAQGTIADLRKEMLTHVHALSMGYFDKRATGKLVIRFVGDAQGLRGWLANKMIAIPSDILTIIGILIAIWTVNHELFFSVLIPPLALLPVLLVINPRARKWTRAGRREQSRLTGDLTDRLGMIAAVKAANAQSKSLEPMCDRIDTIAHSFIRRSYLDASGQAVALTVGSLSLCAIGIWGSVLILNQQATSGDIVGAIWLTVLLRSPINRLTSSNIAYQRVRVAFDRIEALFSRTPEPGFDEGLEPYNGDAMRIRFKELGYHDHHGRWIIRNLSKTLAGPGCVVIRANEISSKTLFELILRIRRPQKGRLGLDGVNARKLRIQDIRSHIGWVDADRMITPATLLTHTLDDLSEMLASTSTISSSLPSQSELNRIMTLEHRTHIHSLGGLRLAIACALINDPPILLLDHPEHGLSKSETEALGEWIKQESEHRLIVIASDKGWARSMADQTIKLDDHFDQDHDGEY